ncbi:MAG: cytochrome c oxidase subunit 4 [Ktedonobacteraceae bacterium]|nr:cytochrome c oxidase subunit 4 [Ktedonobacteraceae bacterium]
METPLQSASLTADDMMTASILPDYEEDEHADDAGNEHLPVPSLWPLILGVAVVVTVVGLIVVDTAPWISIIAAPFVLVGIMGWALEKPVHGHGATTAHAGVEEQQLSPMASVILDRAEQVVERNVTIGSTAWSAHPVSVEVEQEGVVLALYGKVELEAQKQTIEDQVRQLPNVIDVRNFIVAEDALLNAANARIAELRAAGKLEGASDLLVQIENYILSLFGNVPNNKMKYMLENELIAIPGVRVVINHIGLNEEIPGNLGKTRNKVGK